MWNSLRRLAIGHPKARSNFRLVSQNPSLSFKTLPRHANTFILSRRAYHHHHHHHQRVISTFSPNDNDEKNNRDYDDTNNGKSGVLIQHQHQRRYLSSGGGGRRHGWKGGDDADKGNKSKPNFDEEYLQPAARGELREKHSSGIPKLATSKPKGHQIRGGDDPSSRVDDDNDDDESHGTGEEEEEGQYYGSSGEEDERLEDFGSSNSNDTSPKGAGGGDLVDTMKRDVMRNQAKNMAMQEAGEGGGGGGGGDEDDYSLMIPEERERIDQYNCWGEIESFRDPRYWSEEEFDVRTDRERAFFRKKFGNNGSLLGLTRERLDAIRDEGFDWTKVPRHFKFDWQSIKEPGDPMMATTRFTFDDYDKAKDAYGNYAGPVYFDFRMSAGHPESKREPLPYYPQNRKYPHPLLIEFYSRWLYVTNLPPAPLAEGMKFGGGRKPKNLSVLQEQEIQKTVTKLFEVSAEQVFPANEYSAFIGFESPYTRYRIASEGPNQQVLTRPIRMSPYAPTENDNSSDFVQGAEEGTIVKLDDVPPFKFNSRTLPGQLFPQGTELGAAYPVSTGDVLFLSPTTVLIRFDSKERTESALESTAVAKQLEKLGEYQVQYFGAFRNVVHDRMEDATTEIRRQGYRLVVDGDMPSKNFYISHYGVLMLRGLDRQAVTKEMIAEFFQPFSDIRRDVNGSVQFVQSLNGLPTTRAYVGFERLGEAEAIMEKLGGRAKIGDSMVYLKLVKDRLIPGTPERQARPERNEEEILKNLNDWEQYVDPEDVKFLEEHGVAKVVIDDALRGIRFQNRSFGPLDWAKQDERLEPEKESGSDYRELVQMYIETLKECVATPENPGEMYEYLHLPDDEIDLSIFETEKQRIEKLLKKRDGKL